MTPGKALDQINRLIAHLVEVGLADDQRFAFRRNKEVVEITFDSAELITRALKGISHAVVYENFVRDRVFNAKLLDGALIQMMYMFSDNVLIQHRLAFLSAPHLNRFADDEDAYLNDELYVLQCAGRICQMHCISTRHWFATKNRDFQVKIMCRSSLLLTRQVFPQIRTRRLHDAEYR